MRNAAEMALAEFNSPDIQLLVKDDGGSAPRRPAGGAAGARRGCRDHPGAAVRASRSGRSAQVARARGVPVIAFSTDANVAARGVYLLSFLPESDVDRIIGYAVGQGKRSFAALMPDNAYGTVVEAAFKQAVARRGGRVVALERYPARQDARCRGRCATLRRRPRRALTPSSSRTAPTAVPTVVQTLAASGIDTKRVQLLGTGLWEDAQIFSNPALDGAWYAGPDSTGFRNFSARYRTRYGQDPVRTASLAYDAVALVAALVKTPGQAALRRTGPDQLVGLHRHRWAVPLPPRRHQPARARGAARVADRRPDDQRAAQGLRRFRDLSVLRPDLPALIAISTPGVDRRSDCLGRQHRPHGTDRHTVRRQASPHAKTHKSAFIAGKQLAAGAIGIACATLSEAEALAAAGVTGLLITSPIVGADKIARLVQLHRMHRWRSWSIIRAKSRRWPRHWHPASRRSRFLSTSTSARAGPESPTARTAWRWRGRSRISRNSHLRSAGLCRTHPAHY